MDSQFWWGNLGEDFIFDEWLLSQVKHLPRREDITLEIYDYDGTLTNDQKRYSVIPRLAGIKWKDAYGIIAEDLGTEEDPTGFDAMINGLHDGWNFIFSNVPDFYHPENPLHHILSAWAHMFQDGKITRSFWPEAGRSVVLNAEDKPNEILRIIIALGYVPNIVFVDDKIWFFKKRNIDGRLQNILGTKVEFLWATPDYQNNCVILEERTQWAVAWVLAEV